MKKVKNSNDMTISNAIEALNSIHKQSLTESAKYDLGRLINVLTRVKSRLKSFIPYFNFDDITYTASYSTSAVGDYFHNNKKLRLSAYLSEESDEEITSVAAHELCHYMTDVVSSSYPDVEKQLVLSQASIDYALAHNLPGTRFNFNKSIPSIFATPIYYVKNDEIIANPETGEIIFDLSANISRTELALGLVEIFPELSGINYHQIVIIDDPESVEGHGLLWQIFANKVSSLLHVKINRYYTGTKLIDPQATHKLYCPNCNWGSYFKPVDNPQTATTIRNMEAGNFDKILMCPECNTELEVTNIKTNKPVHKTKV